MPSKKRVPTARKAVPPAVKRGRAPNTGRSPTRSSARRGFRPDDASGWWPPKSVPIAVEGGLQAKSQRGRIGESWWSGRFLAVLESFGLGSRLQRGKNYARRGQVIEMQVAPGQVSASVQGSRRKPYRVFIETATLSDREWDSVADAMAARASFVALLLAGAMPDDIEEAFAASSCSLFPDSSDDIDAACSCPDWENPCKHIAAVYYLLAEAFDIDPFLIFAWRGRDKDTLLSTLRARRQGGADERASDVSRGGAGQHAVHRAPHSTGSKTHGGATRSGDLDHDGEEPCADLLGWPVRSPRDGEEPRHAAGPEGAARRVDSRAGSERRSGPGDFWRCAVAPSDLEVRPHLAVAPDLVLRQLDPAALGRDSQKILESLRPMYKAMVTAAMCALDGATERRDDRSGLVSQDLS